MSYLFRMFMVLAVLAAGLSGPARADTSLDPEEALKLLGEKKEHEEAELKRLAAMVRIPAGEFVMGRAGDNSEERPPHRVTLEAFYIDRYEVTQLQFLKAFGKSPAYFSDCPLCPVEKVTYYQAYNYCAKVGKRLPTEAEWEKAARSGTTGDFFWKYDVVDFYAWYGNNSGHRTQPVGQRKPGPLGLHDMSGNVWEWVADWFDPEYYSRSPSRSPRGPAEGKLKVIRGGSWGDPPSHLASAYREAREPNTRYINVGFRCATDTPPDPDHE